MTINSINDHGATFGKSTAAIPTTATGATLLVGEFGLATPTGVNQVDLVGSIVYSVAAGATAPSTLTINIARDNVVIYTATITEIANPSTQLLSRTTAFTWEDVNPPTGYHAYDLSVNQSGSSLTLAGQFSLLGTDYVPGT